VEWIVEANVSKKCSSPSIITSALKMKAAHFFDILASTNQSTWCLNPEECYHRHHRENLIFLITSLCLSIYICIEFNFIIVTCYLLYQLKKIGNLVYLCDYLLFT
jgi:hypothetical protein